LFIDDASTGKEYRESLKNILEDYPDMEVVLKEKNEGIAMTSIQGFKMIDTPYLVRLDSDDYFTRDKFIEYIDYVINNPADMYVND